jgi:hypothetical protein
MTETSTPPRDEISRVEAPKQRLDDTTTSPLARPALLSAVLAVAAAAPALISGVRAVTGGWAPVIDNSAIQVRTHDVFHGHLPLVGFYTTFTTAAHSSSRLHHLGPLEYWLAAIPASLFGPNGLGLVATAALVNALAAAGMVWIGHRLGGPRLAALVAFAAGVLAWSLGGQVLHDPLNAELVVFPFAFLLIAVWCLATGDAWMLPVVVFAASLVAELHLSYVGSALFVTVWGVVGLVLARRRADTTTIRGVERRGSLRWPLIAAVVVALACWSGPIADQIGGSGNMSGLLHALLGGNYATEGVTAAWHGLVHATSLPPVWLTPVTAVVSPDRSPSVIATLTSIAVLLALVIATAWAWMTKTRRVATAGTTALVACLGAFLGTTRTPSASLYNEVVYARRLWWPVGVFVWMTLAYAAVVFAWQRWGHYVRDRAPSPSRWPTPRRLDVLSAGAAIVGVAVIGVIAAWPRLGPAQDYGSGGYGAVRALSPQVSAALPRNGPWLVEWRGDLASYVVGPGVASELIVRGKPVLVHDAAFPDFGAAHMLRRDQQPVGRVVVVSGADVDRVPSGYRLVARWDPNQQGEPYRSYRQTMFVVPLGPVAVYMSTTPR